MTSGETSWSMAHEGVAIDVALRPGAAGGDSLDVHARTEGHGDRAYERLFAALRHASSQRALAERGIDPGFRVEDLLEVLADVRGSEAEVATRWLRRRLPRETSLRVRAALHTATEMRATFVRRGALPTSQRTRYERVDGRIRVEAFELHVVEHCNLRCAHCCNMSPYLPDHTLGVAEIEAMCSAMAAHLDIDVFKIMGGEPLLHPDITGALHAIKRSRVSGTVRLFTNGLLLHQMGDDFWRALDELTISSYASAPVKPPLLEAAREKARAFDVVVNVKPVSEFSEVMRADREDDDAETRRTYDECWLRHRCLVVRRGKFFMCTRAAYASEFHGALLHGAHPGDRDLALAGDGVPLDTPDLGEALLAYLNRDVPLASCRFCYGGAGPVAPHAQLAKGDVLAGRLHPLRVVRS